MGGLSSSVGQQNFWFCKIQWLRRTWIALINLLRKLINLLIYTRNYPIIFSLRVFGYSEYCVLSLRDLILILIRGFGEAPYDILKTVLLES